MAKQKPPFPLRMPDEIREWLEDAAEKNDRSLNSEILHRLKANRREEEERGDIRELAD